MIRKWCFRLNDQRGNPRPVDGDQDGLSICDIGAIEYEYAPNVIFSKTSNINVTELGNEITIDVELTEQPSEDVILDLVLDDPSEALISSNQFVFTVDNWNVAKQLIISGADDQELDGNIMFAIQSQPLISNDLKFSGIDPEDIQVTNYDNDNIKLQVVTDEFSVSESGTSATVTLEFQGQPTSDVTLYMSISDFSEGRFWNNPNDEFIIDCKLHKKFVIPAFSSNLRYGFSVFGVDDNAVDGDGLFDIEFRPLESTDKNFNGFQYSSISFVNTDNDSEASSNQGNDSTGNDSGGGILSMNLLLFMLLVFGTMKYKHRLKKQNINK